MKSKIAGPLIPNKYDSNTYESELIEIPYFDMKLTVSFMDAEHQPFLQGADTVLRNFIKLTHADRISHTAKVDEYYKVVLKNGFTELKISPDKDVWNYIRPNEIFIDWDEKGEFYLSISCGCEWEEEHGLELVFKNGDTLIKADGHG